MKLPKPKKIIAQRYFGGLSIFKRKKVKIKLSANESALGPSPKAIKEYNKVSKNFKRYPDTNGTSLREVIANKFNIDNFIDDEYRSLVRKNYKEDRVDLRKVKQLKKVYTLNGKDLNNVLNQTARLLFTLSLGLSIGLVI